MKTEVIVPKLENEDQFACTPSTVPNAAPSGAALAVGGNRDIKDEPTASSISLPGKRASQGSKRKAKVQKHEDEDYEEGTAKKRRKSTKTQKKEKGAAKSPSEKKKPESSSTRRTWKNKEDLTRWHEWCTTNQNQRLKTFKQPVNRYLIHGAKANAHFLFKCEPRNFELGVLPYEEFTNTHHANAPPGRSYCFESVKRLAYRREAAMSGDQRAFEPQGRSSESVMLNDGKTLWENFNRVRKGEKIPQTLRFYWPKYTLIGIDVYTLHECPCCAYLGIPQSTDIDESTDTDEYAGVVDADDWYY
ncbi:hypothetical protein CYLTODRAFT_450977 [Cylindrobasidium torrendii FP15055 ss-10]|uniref:Uncharacterized protein n=1 Tax=Cylindrobasidium torrendii FP15055 ss-10 TaxID=1314674 RepID=A0A0D7BL12_9AGAR|nr:hypothetical protein CYLTODRAFT_450977 [Cylindrobasidium torrendii FP15055 ss-10]